MGAVSVVVLVATLASCINVGVPVGSGLPAGATPSPSPGITEPTAPDGTQRPRRSRRPRGTTAPTATPGGTTAPTAPPTAPPSVPPQADLIAEVSAPAQVLAGQAFDVSYTIRNIGAGAAGTFHYAFSGPGGAGAGEIAGLAPGEQFDGTTSFTAPAEEGVTTVTITADSDAMIVESFEDNNQASWDVGVIVFELPTIDLPDFPF